MIDDIEDVRAAVNEDKTWYVMAGKRLKTKKNETLKQTSLVSIELFKFLPLSSIDCKIVSGNHGHGHLNFIIN